MVEQKGWQEQDSSRFEFYERVRVRLRDPSRVKIYSQRGVVLSKALVDTADGEQWLYSVWLDWDGKRLVVRESDLAPIGEVEGIERFYRK